MTYFNFFAAIFPSKVGGSLIENLIWIFGCKTFPDPSAFGKSLWPVTVKVGLHDRFNNEVNVLEDTCWQPSKSPYDFIAYYPFVKDIS